MPCEECESLRDRVEALEADTNFAADRCKKGLHAVHPVVRETGGGFAKDFFLACTYCDRLFTLITPTLDAIFAVEAAVDRTKLKNVRELEGVPDRG